MTSPLTVRFYGRLAERFGPSAELGIAPDGVTVAELRASLDDGGALDPARVRAFVADAGVDEDFRLAPGDQVEFLPPLSGG